MIKYIWTALREKGVDADAIYVNGVPHKFEEEKGKFWGFKSESLHETVFKKHNPKQHKEKYAEQVEEKHGGPKTGERDYQARKLDIPELVQKGIKEAAKEDKARLFRDKIEAQRKSQLSADEPPENILHEIKKGP